MSVSSPSLSELVASIALATDMAMGHPMEQGLGTCIVATRMGELAGLSAADLTQTYYLALLRHIGCTTETHGLAALVGDEIRLGAEIDHLSGAKASEYMAAFARFVTAGKPPVAKAGAVARMVMGMRGFNEANRAICEVARMLATRLGFDAGFTHAVGTVYERWDGKGFPSRLTGAHIPLPVRLTQVADLASALYDLGHENPAAVVRERAGSGFDPDVADLFARNASDLLAGLGVTSRWEAAMDLEPGPGQLLTGDRLDESLRAIADFADLKSPFLVGHSSGVASLAEDAAGQLRLPKEDMATVRQAGLVHDLGRVGVSAGVWGKEGALTAGEWESVRLHPYHADRVLCRAPFLAQLSSIASMHHERTDGSGYFRGASGGQMSPAARVLAAADVYHAMTEPRPHRAALIPEQAATEIQREVRGGRLDRESVDAVLQVAGHRVGRRREYAAGLTPREVEVLRLLARGLTIQDIGRALVISPKTAGNHVQSIYAKVSVTTRAAATVFAMQHGLVDTLST